MNNLYKKLVEQAIEVLQRQIVPDGLTDHDALCELHGIFDGPDYRAAVAQDAEENKGPAK